MIRAAVNSGLIIAALSQPASTLTQNAEAEVRLTIERPVFAGAGQQMIVTVVVDIPPGKFSPPRQEENCKVPGCSSHRHRCSRFNCRRFPRLTPFD